MLGHRPMSGGGDAAITGQLLRLLLLMHCGGLKEINKVAMTVFACPM
jgi:hypothetical protein